MSTDPDVRLRALRPSDDEALIALFADPITAQWNPGPPAADVPRWRAENAELADDFRTWVITDGSDDLLGIVSVFSIDDATHTGEIGVRVAPQHRLRGLARTAVDHAVERVADERGVRTIEAWHAVGNAASCRITASCGFVLDAELPANHAYGDGELHDEHRHVRTVDLRS